MVNKQRLESCLERAHAAEQAFAAELTQEQRTALGTYAKWSAKDSLAHIAHWQERLAQRLTALTEGKEPPASQTHYEQANAACFERFCNCSWDEVWAFADSALSQLEMAVRAMDEAKLTHPPPDAPSRALWLDIVGTGYTHPLMHMSEFWTQHGQSKRAGELWQEWGELATPLDDNADWQGLAHYNMACGLALAHNTQPAIDELRQALRLKPSLLAWSRHDSDLSSLHSLRAYRELYAPDYWWKALAASPQVEAMADQFVRTLTMFREAVKAFPAEEWAKGDTPYQRPAGLALHTVEAIQDYTALKPGESGRGRRFGVEWEDRESSRLPAQKALLVYLDEVDKELARFLTDADLMAPEELFRWTGSSLLSRAAYILRHTQHHLAEMCLELHRRGLAAPQWQ